MCGTHNSEGSATVDRRDELMQAVAALGVTPDEVRRGAENFKAPYLRQIAELRAALRLCVDNCIDPTEGEIALTRARDVLKT